MSDCKHLPEHSVAELLPYFKVIFLDSFLGLLLMGIKLRRMGGVR